MDFLQVHWLVLLKSERLHRIIPADCFVYTHTLAVSWMSNYYIFSFSVMRIYSYYKYHISDMPGWINCWIS